MPANRFPFWGCWLVLLLLLAPARTRAAEGLTISWTNNLLTVSGSDLPGKSMEIWYLEAFCRSNSTHQAWDRTKIPHRTELLSSSATELRFRTLVSTNVEVRHEVRAGRDELEFSFTFTNLSAGPVDLEWFQPACVRVERFTGQTQNDYIGRSFIFSEYGLTTLDQTERREEALYQGGQVYVPKGIDLASVNPRPICGTQPINGVIGCFSADNLRLLAIASDQTHELFEGVYVCLHSDPHVGGLKPGETKRFQSRIYFLENNPGALLERYRKDFPAGK